MGKNLSVRDLVLMAFYVALFMVLDTFINTLPMLQMPNGGSLGVSTLALLLASYHLGWKKGLAVAIVAVFAQFITGPMYTPTLIGFLLDYLLAFAAYGLASLFPN
ncbi:energy-coupled thiamine transporter ThiT, partial [uncultured Faecalicoccus sp.]|uniref:energy-coupled thiamine transporter ThiT n=1 Tax=uncultured Faecalicoccus sp. TaxID=1971760 RepID=UPI0025D94536